MERRREDPEPPIDSKLTAMPESMPIDWFEPDAWNSFTVRECVEYSAGGIAVGLPLEMYCDTLAKCVAWKNLPEEELTGRRIHGEIWQQCTGTVPHAN